MRIAVINIPIKTPWLGDDAWITVPPQGYGGIQWMVAALIDGLVVLGHEVFLLGAPGSVSTAASFHVVDRGDAEDIRRWLIENEVDVVHDSSNSLVMLNELAPRLRYLSTHHLTGQPKNPINAVYLSRAQRRQARATSSAPVVRLPVNPARYVFKKEKGDYLLFLGRISPWKGALEASAFAKAAGLPLVLAGPAWESDYLKEIVNTFGEVVRLVGEVGGEKRLRLLAGATALLVMSQPVPGPWGDVWSEPGAMVVAEAAVSGTPVISTNNGCLAEITPKVGRVISRWESITPTLVNEIVGSLPDAERVRVTAINEWGHVKIARQYETLYQRVVGGETWS